MKIAITGNVAGGKTTFSKVLSKKTGFKLISADDIVHNLYKSSEVIKNLKIEFADKIFTEQKLDKKKLRNLIFKNEVDKKKLESFIHPLVKEKIIQELNNNKNIIAEIPLLFEVALEEYFDKIICVFASKEIVIKRLIERGLSTKTANNIINSQLDIEIKKERSDYLIETNNNLKDLKEKTTELIKKL